MKKSEKKASEAFKRKVLARWRLLSLRGVAVERAAVDIGVGTADLATWIREAAGRVSAAARCVRAGGRPNATVERRATAGGSHDGLGHRINYLRRNVVCHGLTRSRSLR
jgi:hypothetical protein